VNWLVPRLSPRQRWVHSALSVKGVLRGPRLFNTDAGIYKNFPIKERFTVQFRAEFFNIFNHPNFYSPSPTPATGYSPGASGDSLNAAGFGDITAARDPRIGQLALKVTF
jgi:hypothetical protein